MPLGTKNPSAKHVKQKFKVKLVKIQFYYRWIFVIVNRLQKESVQSIWIYHSTKEFTIYLVYSKYNLISIKI